MNDNRENETRSFCTREEIFVTDPKALVELPIGIDSFAFGNDNTE